MQTGTTRGRLAAGLALVAAAVLAAGAELAAQDRGGFGGALRYLDLTGGQRAAIRALVREHRESGAEARQALRAARRELRAAVTAEVVNETAIRALAAAAAPLQADAAVRRAQLHAAILEVLTAEQRTELGRLQENVREHRRERRRGWRGQAPD